MDGPNNHLPAAEADRRERVASSIAHALMLADAMQRVALDEYARTPPDSPVVNALSDFQARIEEAVAELHVACWQVEGGRYAYTDPRKPNVETQHLINKLLTGE